MNLKAKITSLSLFVLLFAYACNSDNSKRANPDAERTDTAGNAYRNNNTMTESPGNNVHDSIGANGTMQDKINEGTAIPNSADTTRNNMNPR